MVMPSTGFSFMSDEFEGAAMPTRRESAAKPVQADITEQSDIAEPRLKQDMEQAIAQLTQGDFHRKWDSVKHFSRQFAQWGDRPIPALIEALERHTEAKNTENQWFLIRALSQYDRPVVVEALAHTLITTPAEDIQLEAIKSLTSLGNSAIATLTDLLGSHQPLERQILAASALAKIRTGATIAPLMSVADAADERLRSIAIEALGSFHDPRVTLILLRALNDTSPICIEAIRTLGRRQDLLTEIDLIGSLQGCLHHADAAVAQASSVALGRLGSEPAARALGQALTEPLPTVVKVSVARALGWIDAPIATAMLSQAFAMAMPVVMPVVKQEIARSLGQTRSAQLKTQAAQPLIAWLQSLTAERLTASGSIPAAISTAAIPTAISTASKTAAEADTFGLKQAVISAVARLGEMAAVESLIPLLGDDDARIRMNALSALKQIDPRSARDKVLAYLDRGSDRGGNGGEQSPDEADEYAVRFRQAQISTSLEAW